RRLPRREEPGVVLDHELDDRGPVARVTLRSGGEASDLPRHALRRVVLRAGPGDGATVGGDRHEAVAAEAADERGVEPDVEEQVRLEAVRVEAQPGQPVSRVELAGHRAAGRHRAVDGDGVGALAVGEGGSLRLTDERGYVD